MIYSCNFFAFWGHKQKVGAPIKFFPAQKIVPLRLKCFLRHWFHAPAKIAFFAETYEQSRI